MHFSDVTLASWFLGKNSCDLIAFVAGNAYFPHSLSQRVTRNVAGDFNVTYQKKGGKDHPLRKILTILVMFSYPLGTSGDTRTRVTCLNNDNIKSKTQ